MNDALLESLDKTNTAYSWINRQSREAAEMIRKQREEIEFMRLELTIFQSRCLKLSGQVEILTDLLKKQLRTFRKGVKNGKKDF
jgi:hypothetical protein